MSEHHLTEPTHMYAAVRDSEGDIWQRRLHWWHCMTEKGKLTWVDLVRKYGPLVVDAGTDNYEVRARSRRGWKTTPGVTTPDE